MGAGRPWRMLRRGAAVCRAGAVAGGRARWSKYEAYLVESLFGRRRQEFHCVAALFDIHSAVLSSQIGESKRSGQVISLVDVTPACFAFVRE